MQRVEGLHSGRHFSVPKAEPLALGGALAGLCVLGALVGAFPVAASIVTVFLFAAPHNFMEVRFFLSRMPVRWGRAKAFFVTSIGGALTLTGVFAALPFLASSLNFSESGWVMANAAWNSALVLWVFLLTRLYVRERPRAWDWHLPVVFALLALAWFFPQGFSIALVFLHPLVALWFLDSQIARTRPAWRSTYRKGLVLAAAVFVVMLASTAGAPNLPGRDGLTIRITDHAGGSVISGISTHGLVAGHVFLETLHYGVWLVAMPLVALGGKPFRLDTIPLVKHSEGWPKSVKTLLACGAGAVAVFWMCFLVNYPITRDVYFTVAIFHVLAEAPFLIRLK
jgi:hypothetical protein